MEVGFEGIGDFDSADPWQRYIAHQAAKGNYPRTIVCKAEDVDESAGMREAHPFPKETQLARGERRHYRKVASASSWQRLIDAKQGPCRVCASRKGPIEFHHVVPRSRGGGDVADNIVPLCRDDHRRITERDKQACRDLRISLSDAEYAYALDTLGEDPFDTLYPVVWS